MGTTDQFTMEIGDSLFREWINMKVMPIFKYYPQDQGGVNMVLLGCWTSGVMIILQHSGRT